jgi:hypothetical protein
MTDLLLTLELPKELLERANSAKVDVRQTVIEALERKVLETTLNVPNKMPTREEIDAFVKKAEARLASGEVQARTWEYLNGDFSLADDFDDELPDSFWFGDDE